MSLQCRLPSPNLPTLIHNPEGYALVSIQQKWKMFLLFQFSMSNLPHHEFLDVNVSLQT